MPYKKNHKGKSRQFTNVEELESQRKQDEQRRAAKQAESSSEEEEEGDNQQRSVIDVQNPNRVAQKNKKISQLDDVVAKPVELSRREKEEIAKQESARRYQQLHAEGKTDEAKADLARLAIIRKQREESARKREEEKKEKEARAQAGKEASLNAIKSKGGGARKKR
uniref:28 kDa heat- and acid-stable phosphoprotein-like n=1 Tax=Phallusia mammillata TaxID=59560 RepID=A0A6F9DNK3_9ASCI|nr:28 kDa heat- and acid-stable phosphoprotein-like [Phallusia mammillata]